VRKRINILAGRLPSVRGCELMRKIRATHVCMSCCYSNNTKVHSEWWCVISGRYSGPWYNQVQVAEWAKDRISSPLWSAATVLHISYKWRQPSSQKRDGPAQLLFFIFPLHWTALVDLTTGKFKSTPWHDRFANVYSQLLWSSNFTEIGRDAGHQHLVKSREAEAMSSSAIRGIYRRWND
jgi:hypothetical protein